MPETQINKYRIYIVYYTENISYQFSLQITYTSSFIIIITLCSNSLILLFLVTSALIFLTRIDMRYIYILT